MIFDDDDYDDSADNGGDDYCDDGNADIDDYDGYSAD